MREILESAMESLLVDLIDVEARADERNESEWHGKRSEEHTSELQSPI